MCGPLPQRFDSITFDVDFQPVNSSVLVSCAVLHPVTPAPAPVAGPLLQRSPVRPPLVQGPALAVPQLGAPPPVQLATVEGGVLDGTADTIVLDDPSLAGGGPATKPTTRATVSVAPAKVFPLILKPSSPTIGMDAVAM